MSAPTAGSADFVSKLCLGVTHLVPVLILTCELLRLGNSAWGPYLLASMALCYFVVFLYFMALGFYQLRSRPCSEVRTAVILYRLQVRVCHPECKAQGPGVQ